MKKLQKNTCEVCGRELTVVIGGKKEPLRLCIHCLIASYPSLRELEKVV